MIHSKWCDALSLTSNDSLFGYSLDINGWPPPVCQFPEWLQGTVWRDIEGRNSYELDDKAKEIAGYYRKRVNSRSHMKYQFRCMEILEEDLAEEEMTLLSFSTHRWWGSANIYTWAHEYSNFSLCKLYFLHFQCFKTPVSEIEKD